MAKAMSAKAMMAKAMMAKVMRPKVMRTELMRQRPLWKIEFRANTTTKNKVSRDIHTG